jgi:hypothetical protein
MAALYFGFRVKFCFQFGECDFCEELGGIGYDRITVGEGCLRSGGGDEFVVGPPFQQKQGRDACRPGDVVRRRGGFRGRQSFAEIRERGLGRSVAVALRFGFLSKRAPVVGEGGEIGVAADATEFLGDFTLAVNPMRF